MNICADSTFRLLMIDDEVLSITESKEISVLVKLVESKKYIPIPADDSIFRAKTNNSIAVIFPVIGDDEPANLRAIEMFDEIIFRNKFNDTLFKLVDYKGYKLIIDQDNIVVRYSSREKEIKVGGNFKVLKGNMNYEEAFKEMQNNMIEELNKQK